MVMMMVIDAAEERNSLLIIIHQDTHFVLIDEYGVVNEVQYWCEMERVGEGGSSVYFRRYDFGGGC